MVVRINDYVPKGQDSTMVARINAPEEYYIFLQTTKMNQGANNLQRQWHFNFQLYTYSHIIVWRCSSTARWLDKDDLRKRPQRRNTLRQQAHETNSESIWQAFRDVRNLLEKKRSKRLDSHSLTKHYHRRNLRTIWQIYTQAYKLLGLTWILSTSTLQVQLQEQQELK